MNRVKRLVNNRIKDNVQKHDTSCRGKVVSHDLRSNTINVSYVTSLGRFGNLKNVPVRANPGMHASKLRVGTTVYLSFPNGDKQAAFVMAIGDEAFHRNTRTLQKHERKGAYLPEMISERNEF